MWFLNDFIFALVYQITCDGNSTGIFHFRTLSKDINRPPTSLIFGDLGYLGGHSFDYLLRDVVKGIGNVLIHVGQSIVIICLFLIFSHIYN